MRRLNLVGFDPADCYCICTFMRTPTVFDSLSRRTRVPHIEGTAGNPSCRSLTGIWTRFELPLTSQHRGSKPQAGRVRKVQCIETPTNSTTLRHFRLSFPGQSPPTHLDRLRWIFSPVAAASPSALKRQASIRSVSRWIWMPAQPTTVIFSASATSCF